MLKSTHFDVVHDLLTKIGADAAVNGAYRSEVRSWSRISGSIEPARLADLADPGVLARLLLREGVDEVVRHALQGDEDLDCRVETTKKEGRPCS